MEKNDKPILQLIVAVIKARTDCYWCGKPLQKCAACYGSGAINDSLCWPCKGNGRICATHQANWQG